MHWTAADSLHRCINLGSLSLLATPFMEKYKGFWTAYLLCFCVFNVGIFVLIVRRKSYVDRPPQGSVITDAFKAIGMMIASRNYDAPKPSWRAANGKTKPVPWSNHFVLELQRALRACKVFALYPIFWVRLLLFPLPNSQADLPLFIAGLLWPILRQFRFSSVRRLERTPATCFRHV